MSHHLSATRHGYCGATRVFSQFDRRPATTIMRWDLSGLLFTGQAAMRRLLTRSPAAMGVSTGVLAVVASTAIFLFEFRRSSADGLHPGVGQLSTPVPESPRAAGRLSAPPLVPFPYRLAPGICILGGLEPSAAYVIETTKGLVLVDAGLQSDAGLLKSQLEHLGLDWKQIRAILITHAHGDHSGGAERLRTETGARVYAGRGDAAVLRAGDRARRFSARSRCPAASFTQPRSMSSSPGTNRSTSAGRESRRWQRPATLPAVSVT